MFGNLAPKYVHYIRTTKNERYKKYAIPKPNGKKRIVYEADEHLRYVQYVLLREVFDQVPLPDYLYAFEHNRRAVDMAKVHVGAGMVISWDIKDFFPGITQKKILEVFSDIWPEEKAWLYSELVTRKAFLPQGAVTSPKVANLVTAKTFGPILLDYFTEKCGKFTVYADDITVSFPDVSWDLAYESDKKVQEELAKVGLRLNTRKTKMMPFYKRQYVLGATVNVKTHLPREKRDRLRAAVHNITVRGLEFEARRLGQDPHQLLASIRGKLAWYKQLNPQQADKLLQKLQSIKEVPSTTLP